MGSESSFDVSKHCQNCTHINLSKKRAAVGQLNQFGNPRRSNLFSSDFFNASLFLKILMRPFLPLGCSSAQVRTILGQLRTFWSSLGRTCLIYHLSNCRAPIALWTGVIFIASSSSITSVQVGLIAHADILQYWIATYVRMHVCTVPISNHIEVYLNGQGSNESDLSLVTFVLSAKFSAIDTPIHCVDMALGCGINKHAWHSWGRCENSKSKVCSPFRALRYWMIARHGVLF